jgi:hypothetical protein
LVQKGGWKLSSLAPAAAKTPSEILTIFDFRTLFPIFIIIAITTIINIFTMLSQDVSSPVLSVLGSAIVVVLGRFSAKEKANDDWRATKSCPPRSRRPIESSYSIKLMTTRKAHSTASATVAVPGSRCRKVKIGPRSVNFFRIPAVALEENAAASYRARQRSYKPSLGSIKEVELRIGVCASLPPAPIKPKRRDLSVTQLVQQQIIEHEHANWACTTDDGERRFEPIIHVDVSTTTTVLPRPPAKLKRRNLSVTQRVQWQIAEHEHTTWACTSDGFEPPLLLLPELVPTADDSDVDVSTTTTTVLPRPPAKLKRRNLSVTQRVQWQIAEHEHTTWACTSDGFEPPLLLLPALVPTADDSDDDDSCLFELPVSDDDDFPSSTSTENEEEPALEPALEPVVHVVYVPTLRRSARLRAQREGNLEEPLMGLTMVNGRRRSLRVMRRRG